MKSIKLPDFELIGPAMFIPKTKTLVLGDLHVGSDEELAASGAFSPLIGLSEIEEIVGELIRNKKPDIIVLLGDLEVHFGSIPPKQRNAIMNFITKAKNSCKKLVIIKGNHDKFITTILKNTTEEPVDNFVQGDFFFCHGDKLFETECKYTVIGHEHPAVTISNNIRREKYKCTIVSERLVVLPSINQTSIGTDVFKEKILSPYITKKVLKDADVYVIEKFDIYPFGKNIQ